MSKEFPNWLARTASAVENRNPAPKSKEPELSTDERRDLFESALQEVLYQWKRLDIDQVLLEVATSMGLVIREKGLLFLHLDCEPEETLVERALRKADFDDPITARRHNIGITVTVDEALKSSQKDSDNFFALTVTSEMILISTTQLVPSRRSGIQNDYNNYKVVRQNLGVPAKIKNSEIFKDRLDGFFESLVENYPTFIAERKNI